MPNRLFPGRFTPCRAGVLRLGVAHAAGLPVGFQAQGSAARGAAGSTLGDFICARGHRRCIGREVAVGNGRNCAMGAGNAGSFETNATIRRLARSSVGLATAPDADVIGTAKFGARTERCVRRPARLVCEPLGTDADRRPGVACRSESGVANGAGVGKNR
jgi:hypothetical protein